LVTEGFKVLRMVALGAFGSEPGVVEVGAAIAASPGTLAG
jgi:hypothetical protein